MEVRSTPIPEVKVLVPKRFGDARGHFAEVYNRRVLQGLGIDLAFVQDNHAYSKTRGTLRGLHFQKPPMSQAKLLRVTRGRALDVAVDCRVGSPTYGHHVAVELSAANGEQMLTPHGFAHGALSLEDDTEVTYKVDAYYAPELDCGLAFDDPDVGIAWPIPEDQLILSEKDRKWPRLRDLGPIFTYA